MFSCKHITAFVHVYSVILMSLYLYQYEWCNFYLACFSDTISKVFLTLTLC